jgi:ADP-heptose:LPS heptosyltransferase
MKQILVIMHGALGDWIFATAAFQAVRQHHKKDHIILLTSSFLKDVAERSPFFDAVWIDDRHRVQHMHRLLPVLLKLRSQFFDIVYDFKNSNRTSLYKLWMKGRFRVWSENRNKSLNSHVLNWHEEQLNKAGITSVPKLPNINWMDTPIELPEAPYALLIPGSAAHRKEKRWGENGFVQIAQYLTSKKITPVLVGTERFDLLSPVCLDFTGKTQLSQLSFLASHALLVIGGDTGPTHLAAARGALTLCIFGSDKYLTAFSPKGPKASLLKKIPLSSLKSEEIIAFLEEKGWVVS